MADSTYKVVVGATLNGVTAYFDLDTCVARSLTSSATVTSFPIENGLSASDHMYRNPRTFTLSGTFSLNRGGHRIVDSYTMDAIQSWHPEGGTVSWEDWLQDEGAALKSLNAENYLQSVQTVFEYIQEKGILCQIMMAQDTKESSARFKVRNNMVLQNIQWQEMYNSMTYSFTFQEVISIIKEQEFETFGYNELYPSVYLPATKSIGEMVTETGSLYQIVIEMLYQYGYIGIADGYALSLIGSNNSFWKMIGEVAVHHVKNVAGVSLIYAGAGGVAVGTVALIALGVVTGGAAILVAVVGAVLAIGLGIGGVATLKNSAQGAKNSATRRNHFKLLKNYAKYVDPKTLNVIDSQVSESDVNVGEIARLRLLLNAIQANISNTMTNISLYQISTIEGDMKDRECPIQVGNDLLTLRINKTNDSESPYAITILRLANGDKEETIASLYGTWPACGNLYTLNRNVNSIYVDRTNQYEMFLYNPYLEEDMRKAKGYSQVEAKAYLSNYYLVVSKGNINDNMKKLSEAINSAFISEGYGD